MISASPRTPIFTRLIVLLVGALALAVVGAAPAQAVNHSISGTVTVPAGFDPTNVSITAYFDEGGFWDWADSTSADVTGHYTLSLPAGQYKIGFSDNANSGLLREFYNDKPTVDAGDLVDISTASVAAVNATLAEGGHVTGTVPEFAAGGGEVDVYQTDGGDDGFYGIANVDTGETTYDVRGLPTGTYKVQFLPYGNDFLSEFYNNQSSYDSADTISVTAGATTSGVDASLTQAGHVTGTVPQFLDNGGWVQAYYENSPGDWWQVAYASVDAGATTYDLGSLPTGNYAIQFGADGYVSEYYNDKTSPDTADLVAVTGGSTTPGIDAALIPVGHISGKVTTYTGAAAVYAQIDVFKLVDNGSGPEWTQVDWSETEEDGTYDLQLAPGSYRLGFDAGDNVDVYEYYNNHYTLSSANTLVVASGAVLSGRNVQLAKGAKITGTVKVPSGTKAVSVQVVTSAGAVAAGGTARPTATANTLSYSIGGIAAGTYRVEFARASGGANHAPLLGAAPTMNRPTTTPKRPTTSKEAVTALSQGTYSSSVIVARSSMPSLVEGQFYNGVPESKGASAANRFSLALGQSKTAVNATMRTGSTITGYLLDGSGAPMSYCQVTAYTADGSLVGRSAAVGTDGGFRITGLSTGAYRIAVESGWDPGTQATVCADPEYYVGNSGDLSADDSGSVTVSTSVGRDRKLSTPLYYGADTLPSLTATQNTVAPTVSGTYAVGRKLTASAGSWSPTAKRVRYQWLRNGVGIAGLVSSSYTLTAADKGQKISARVTAIATGDTPTTKTTVAKTVAAGTLSVSGSNTIVGTLKVGYTLKTPYAVPSGATVKYRWYRNGSPIAYASRSTYKLVSADRGKKISLKATFSKPGYTTVTKTATKAGTVS